MQLLTELTRNASKLCFIDLESTQIEHETIAIGAVLAYVGADGMPKPPFKEFKTLIKAHYRVGDIITELTGITDSMLDVSPTFETAVKTLCEFLKDGSETFGNVRFICFGNQDRRMMKISTEIAHNSEIQNFDAFFNSNYVDFDRFIARFIKDKNNNTLSLRNLLKLFGIEPYGRNHDPLSDAYDLLKLYIAFYDNRDLVKKLYLEKLKREMDVPEVLKPSVIKILNNKKVRRNDFVKDLSEYFK